MSGDYRVIMLGPGSVGKSAITLNFIHSRFVETYDPTIEDSYQKQLMLDGKPARVAILDTAGQEDYSVLREQYMRSGEGFVLVYDITNEATFRELMTFHERICLVKDTNSFPLVVVGNKCDLTNKRAVPTERGQQKAEEWGAAFFETSAKNHVNVDEVFYAIVRAVRKSRGATDPAADTTDGGATKRKSLCTLV
eukprot:Mycagemm_TRINITY_DN2518_c0_g1::TRINITY_DN2518_c0_g1_i1::g.4571::m.4571 type:complete len:194 gc:universal TRINITY_DN2518_c0_g1_i1:2-583(+)